METLLAILKLISGSYGEELTKEARSLRSALERIEKGVAVNQGLLIGIKQTLEDGPLEEPEEVPKHEKKATDYIPWDDRAEWANKLELAYSEWRGARDLRSLVNTPFLRGGAREMVPLTASDIERIALEMDVLQTRSRNLQYRIRSEEHRDFAGRSQVRKEVAHEMLDLLEEATDRYHGIERLIPAQEGCDSIKCRVKKLMEGEQQ